MTITTPTSGLVLEAPEHLPFIEGTRDLAAPVAAVFAAHVEPESVRRWLGPDGYEMEIERWDIRPGGGYRYTHRSPEGGEYVFTGVVHSAVVGEGITQTFEFEGAPGVVSLESVRFEALPAGGTRLHLHAVYPSLAARDAMIENGMERGMSEGYRRLDALLAEG